MSTVLLDKARAILAHTNRGVLPKVRIMETEKNTAPTTELTVPTITQDGTALSHATSAIQNVEIQPAPPNVKGIYWESGTGQIFGPAVPEFLAGEGSTFWISTTFEGQIGWINADRLCSRKASEGQGAMNNQPKEGKPRKLDRKKVLDLHARGFSAPEIAQQQGVAHSTVWRFLERAKPN